MTLNSFIAIIMLVFIAALAVSTVMVSVLLIKEIKKIKSQRIVSEKTKGEDENIENQ